MQTPRNGFLLEFRNMCRLKIAFRIFIWGLSSLGVVACRNSEKKSPVDDLVKSEIRNIDWNDVDRYPLFEECGENGSKGEQKDCFESRFVSYLYEGMNKHNIVIHGSVEDTIYVRFLIARTGEISVVEIESPELWQKRVPQLDSLVRLGLENIPKPYPALKRDIPVATKYRLPLLLNGDVEKTQ
ncbi:hypothetical protein [Sinomicrobium sp.]